MSGRNGVPQFACRCLNFQLWIEANACTRAVNKEHSHEKVESGYARVAVEPNGFSVAHPNLIQTSIIGTSCIVHCLFCKLDIYRVDYDGTLPFFNSLPVSKSGWVEVTVKLKGSHWWDYCISGKAVNEALQSPFFSPKYQLLLGQGKPASDGKSLLHHREQTLLSSHGTLLSLPVKLPPGSHYVQKTPKKRRFFPSLTPELLMIALRLVRPAYHTHKDAYRNEFICKFQRDRAWFADLARVSSQWEPLVMTILYSEVLIFKTSKPLSLLRSSLSKRCRLVEHVIVDSTFQANFGADVDKTFPREVWDCLSAVPDLKSLDCTDVLLFDFTKSKRKIAPGPRLRSLKMGFFTHRGANEVSLALSDQASNLRSLEIENWTSGISNSENLPHLKRFALTEGTEAPTEEVRQLLGRVTRRESSDKKSVPLRELCFKDVVGFDKSTVLKMLAVNEISRVLTSLTLRLRYEFEPKASDFPIELVKLCTSLVHFSYTSPASKILFRSLPPKLRSLEVATITSSQSRLEDADEEDEKVGKTDTISDLDVEDVLDYLYSAASRNLKFFSVIRRKIQIVPEDRAEDTTRRCVVLPTWKGGLLRIMATCETRQIRFVYAEHLEVLETMTSLHVDSYHKYRS